jgi:hypothetical protein
MSPGLAAIALFFDRVRAAAEQPDTTRLLAVLAVGVVIVAALLLLRGRLRRARSG